MTPAGLEPAIPGSVGRCLIHWATGLSGALLQVHNFRSARSWGHTRATAGCTVKWELAMRPGGNADPGVTT